MQKNAAAQTACNSYTGDSFFSLNGTLFMLYTESGLDRIK